MLSLCSIRVCTLPDQQGLTNGLFAPAAQVQPATTLQGYADSCMLSLCKVLSDDWPTSFLQVRVATSDILM